MGGPLSFNLMSASGTDVEKYMSRRLYNAGTFALMMLNGLAAMTTQGKVSRLRRKVRRRHDPSVLAQIAFEQENSHGAR